MKKQMILVCIYQEGISFTQKYETSGKMNADKVIGSALRETFKLVELKKKIGSGLSLAKPIGVSFEYEGLKYDTGTLDITLQAKLKMNSTSKSKRKFADKFTAIYDFVTSERKAISLAEVVKELK
jgi:hypothetical protein